MVRPESAVVMLTIPVQTPLEKEPGEFGLIVPVEIFKVGVPL